MNQTTVDNWNNYTSKALLSRIKPLLTNPLQSHSPINPKLKKQVNDNVNVLKTQQNWSKLDEELRLVDRAGLTLLWAKIIFLPSKIYIQIMFKIFLKLIVIFCIFYDENKIICISNIFGPFSILFIIFVNFLYKNIDFLKNWTP